MNGCGSTNTGASLNLSRPSDRCTRDAGHEGQCRDRYGRTWTRLEKLLRQDGLRLFGYLVQRIES